MPDDKQKQIDEIREKIDAIEKELSEAKKQLAALGADFNVPSAKPQKVKTPKVEGGKIIEGIFDGEGMLAEGGQIYPVPANYASKSKLVEGDRLKLTIAEDGTFVFKQIGPTERKKLIGTLNFDNNVYTVSAEGKNYNVLYASVTYFKAKAQDRVTIVVPAAEDSKWAAIENIIHEGGTEPKPPEPNILSDEPKVKAPTGDANTATISGLPDFADMDEPPAPPQPAQPEMQAPFEEKHTRQNPADELEI